jgi:hypothetical protein
MRTPADMEIPDLLRRGAKSVPDHVGLAAEPITRLLRMAAWDAELCNRINARNPDSVDKAQVAYHPMVTEAIKIACAFLGESSDQVLMLLPRLAQDQQNPFAWEESEAP